MFQLISYKIGFAEKKEFEGSRGHDFQGAHSYGIKWSFVSKICFKNWAFFNTVQSVP